MARTRRSGHGLGFACDKPAIRWLGKQHDRARPDRLRIQPFDLGEGGRSQPTIHPFIEAPHRVAALRQEGEAG